MSGIFKTFQSTTVQTLSTVGNVVGAVSNGLTMLTDTIEDHSKAQQLTRNRKVFELVQSAQATYKEAAMNRKLELNKLLSDPIKSKAYAESEEEYLQFVETLNNN